MNYGYHDYRLMRTMVFASSLPMRASPIPHRPSSLGCLDCLPLELLYEVLNMLDFRSVHRISLVSLRGKKIAESLPAYHELTHYGAEGIRALDAVGLLPVHSVATLRAALREQLCAYCRGQFGPFLSLPTARRCCFECLRHKPALRVVTPSLAARVFALSSDEIRQHVPTLTSVPGHYGLDARECRKGRELVSVEAVSALSVRLYGEGQALLRQLTRTATKRFRTYESRIECYFLQLAVPSPVVLDLHFGPPAGLDVLQPDDRYFGMATTHFPSYQPRDGQADDDCVELGLWCRACDALALNQWPFPLLLTDPYRAYTKEGFKEHIQTCRGVPRS